MSTPAPEVTVVIPTRNRSPLLLEHGLASALAQEDVTLEVIVVDDGSTDDTATVLATVDDPRLRVLHQAYPRGPSAARNAGIREAWGRWIAFLDDDDVWAPRKLRLQLDTAAAVGAGWVYGRSVVVDGDLVPVGLESFPDPSRLQELLPAGNVIPIGCSNVVVRTDLVAGLGGFDETLESFEDWDLWIRLANAAPAAACEDIVTARVAHASRPRTSVHAELDRHAAMLGKHRPVTRQDRRLALEWLAYREHRAGRRAAAARLYLRLAFAYRTPGNLVAAGGAMFGERGMALASRLLVATRGRSHVGEVTADPPPTPAWLARYARAK